MLRQDFVERMIQQLGAALSRALGKRAEGDQKAALGCLEDGYGDVFGLDAGLLAALDPTMLFSLLRDDAEAPLVARLMRHEAEQLTIMQLPRARLVGRRALEILAAHAQRHTLDAASRADVRALQGAFGLDDLRRADVDCLREAMRGDEAAD